MVVRTLVCHLVVPGSNLVKVTICLHFYWNFENVLFLILGPSIMPYDCPTWKLHRTGFGMFGIKKLARLERWYMCRKVRYRIRVNTTPAAYKIIGVFGWWLIEMWWKFVKFLLKKAPKSGLLGKKVAAYLNFNQIL